MKISVYKSKEHKDQFRANYQAILNTFPFEQKSLETSYGETFMITAGDPTSPPVILLHGSCSNSAFWFPEIMALSSSFRVYAIDILGEAGMSSEFRPQLSTDAFANWLGEVLDQLGLDQVAVIGNSLGGWMALKLATHTPAKVSKLVLIASAGLADIQESFIDDVTSPINSGERVEVDANVLGQDQIPEPILAFMNLIISSYTPIQNLPAFEDLELSKLNMPLLFIDGEDDVIINAGDSAKRLKDLVPTSEIHLIKGCGHMIPNTMDYIMPFLTK